MIDIKLPEAIQLYINSSDDGEHLIDEEDPVRSKEMYKRYLQSLSYDELKDHGIRFKESLVAIERCLIDNQIEYSTDALNMLLKLGEDSQVTAGLLGEYLTYKLH